jgi:cysteine synthase
VIHESAIATVGETPLVEFSRLGGGLPARIVGKLEMRNPAGSVEDRLGVALIEDAERRGVHQPARGAALGPEEILLTPPSCRKRRTGSIQM